MLTFLPDEVAGGLQACSGSATWISLCDLLGWGTLLSSSVIARAALTIQIIYFHDI